MSGGPDERARSSDGGEAQRYEVRADRVAERASAAETLAAALQAGVVAIVEAEVAASHQRTDAVGDASPLEVRSDRGIDEVKR